MILLGLNRLLPLLIGLLLLSGCAAMRGEVPDGVKPEVAAEELAGTELLDVAIVVFASEPLTENETNEQGLSEAIRQAEERFVPIHLKYTMQRTGYWGAVRVVPGESRADLLVRGTITHSDGERLSLDIEAVDARGIVWLEESYTETLRPAEHSNIVPEKKDPFQDLYHAIANDLAEYRKQLTGDDLEEIKRLSALRFAHDMAPEAFDGHFIQDQAGRYRLQRLPDKDDPMLERVRSVEVRDGMLLDTINRYYDIYYQDLWQPYADWRKLRSEEAAAVAEIKKQALTRQLLGVAAIAAGVLLGSKRNVNTSGLPEVMVIGGAAAIYSGFQKREETKIHQAAIEELSISFASEAEPLVVEVVGETVRLTGSAEEQYQRWRQMLRQIYAAETGLPLDGEPAGDGEGAGQEKAAPAAEVWSNQ